MTVGWNILRDRGELRKLERFTALTEQLPAGSQAAVMFGDIRNRLAVRVALASEAPPYRLRWIFGWTVLVVGGVVAVGWVVFASIAAGPSSWKEPVVWGTYLAGLVVAMAGQGVLVFRESAISSWKETRSAEYTSPELRHHTSAEATHRLVMLDDAARPSPGP
ncbi:hypothetical protein EDF46_3465 [Frondihabitans sp. PhB188]|nr:hypothetical protein EDF46_3465 [Frondihabitans sp. PhB188]